MPDPAQTNDLLRMEETVVFPIRVQMKIRYKQILLFKSFNWSDSFW